MLILFLNASSAARVVVAGAMKTMASNSAIDGSSIVIVLKKLRTNLHLYKLGWIIL